MIHGLELRINAVEGALLRLFGTLERRGFRVRDCRVAVEDDSYRIRLQVQGTRDTTTLCRQLERLLDVREVALCDDDTDKAPMALQSV